MKKKHSNYSLYKRAGTWYVRAWDELAGEYTTGKSTGETNRDKAAEKAGEMMKSGAIKKRTEDPFFLDHLREYWETRRDVSTAYQRETLRAIEKRIAPFKEFQGLRLSQIKPGHVHRFIDELKKNGVTVRPINRIIQSIKTYLSWAYTRDHLTRDIAGKIEKEKEPKNPRGFLEPEEIIKLAGLPWPDLRVKAAVALGLFAGLRRGEIFALQWGDIDFEKNTIDVKRNFVGEYDAEGNPIFKKPKTDSGRRFPYLIFSELKNTLLDLYRETPFKKSRDLVLVNVWTTRKYTGAAPREYRPMNEITIRRDFSRMLEKIGITAEDQRLRKLVFHGLRHSFASLMSTVATVSAVMPLTGHKQVSTFQGYAHGIDAAAVAALEAANRALDPFRGLDNQGGTTENGAGGVH